MGWFNLVCIDSFILAIQLTQQLLGKGNTVIAASRNPDSAKSLQSLAASGAKISLTQLDVTDIESIKARPIYIFGTTLGIQLFHSMHLVLCVVSCGLQQNMRVAHDG